MVRIPTTAKRMLLPLWNGGHRLCRRLGAWGEAMRRGRFESCAVCGRFGPVLYRRGVVPRRLEELWGLSMRQAEAFARKESNQCAWCGANLRARRLGRALLNAVPTAVPCRSVAEWVRRPESRSVRLAEINRIDGLHAQLTRLPGCVASDYQPGTAPGAVVNGVRSEDLTCLTYPDSSFDLVLTSETLEHVPDLAAALAEVRRVLAPGGLHLFTVPLVPGVSTTFARAVVDRDGSVRHLAPPLHHPGGDVGYLVFTEFGIDLPTVLARAGFETEVAFGPTTDDDLAQVFVCRSRR